MNLSKVLDGLEDKFYGEWEEDKEQLFEELNTIHREVLKDKDEFSRFIVQIYDRFGGCYIPFVFWSKMSQYMEEPEQRTYLFELTRAFTNSDFDEAEQKKMKPLLITYFAREKQFELDKIQTLVVEKAHPSVKEYFYKLFNFVSKNERATAMYCEKFEILKNIYPDFKMMSLPITQLKEQVPQA